MLYQGGCHCGKIAFEVEGELTQVMECNCSLCSKRGYLLWFVPREQLRLSTPESNLATYLFNTKKIQHHFCPTRGCAPFGEASNKGVAMAAVNVRCLDGVELETLKVAKVDGRSR
ncbi:GFA family protein [Pseudomonas cavernicola]|uniref:GFA family protein n=1 Tax=Pseudomonas cavernicola TaxID=2320866 RepID=A0A418XLY2_9PSED|nr:GFA family protein [Pseudomonas cavernicola]RJG13482.1 GFA family protein [Pseudomonas cavernicola]